MSADDNGGKRTAKEIGYLEGRFDGLEKEVAEVKVTQGRIFDKIDDVQKSVISRIDGIHCQKESTFADIGLKIEKLEKTTFKGVEEKERAKGWLFAMEWIIKIGLIVIGLVISYKAYRLK